MEMMILTSGLREPGEDIGGKLVGFLEGVTASPLVLDGHLEAVPSGEKQRDFLLEMVRDSL